MVSLSNLLNEVFRENFQVWHISAEAVDCLFFEMKGTLLKLLGSIEDPYRREAASRKILALQPGPSAERWFQAITEILEELSSVLAKEREQKTGGPIPEIRRYVEEHFSEPQLNLNDVADHFRLTPSYLSQLFKEQVGVNFSSFLEDLRLEAACRCLDQQMPVSEVAEKVGYSSVYVFRSAFKRKLGIPPSGYRPK